MALSILENAGPQLVNTINKNNQALSKTLRLLGAGQLTRAADDVVAIALGSQLTQQHTEIQVARQNTVQAKAFLDIADGTARQVGDLVNRATELATQAANGTLSDADRANLNTEFQAVIAEIDRLTGDTEFNGSNLFNASQDVTLSNQSAGIVAASATGLNIEDPGAVDNLSFDAAKNEFSVTINGEQFTGTIDPGDIDQNTGNLKGDATVRLTSNAPNNTQSGDIVLRLDENFNTSADIADAGDLQVSGAASENQFDFRVGANQEALSVGLNGLNSEALGLEGLDISTVDGANEALAALGEATNTVSASRAEIGAAQASVGQARETLDVAGENIEAARAAILEVNVAELNSQKTAQEVLLNASIATLAQGNQNAQNILKLLSPV